MIEKYIPYEVIMESLASGIEGLGSWVRVQSFAGLRFQGLELRCVGSGAPVWG